MRRALALAVAALVVAAPVAVACPKTSLADVEDEVMCPVCGTPLALANQAPQAERQRALIRRLVDQCKSKDEIKAALVAEFGERVLAVPDDDGFGLAAYLVPAAALLAGLVAMALTARRWRRRRPAVAADEQPELDPADAERLDAELRRYEPL